MTLLQRVLSGDAGEVELKVEQSHIHMRTANATISARLIEGHFPPYEDVLPKEYEKKLQLPVESFVLALRRAALLSTKDSHAVRFEFDREGLQLTARVPEVGEARVRFPFTFPYETLTVGFNPAFFVEALKIVGGEEFQLELRDARSAAVIRKSYGEGRLFVYLVMPVNLGN